MIILFQENLAVFQNKYSYRHLQYQFIKSKILLKGKASFQIKVHSGAKAYMQSWANKKR